MAADSSPQSPRERSEKVFESAGRSLDRLPMLPIVIDKVAKGFGDLLRRSTETPSQFVVKGIASQKMGEFLDQSDGNSVAAVFHAPAWDQRLLITIDRSFIFTLVELLLGGDGSEPAYSEERDFSQSRCISPVPIRPGRDDFGRSLCDRCPVPIPIRARRNKNGIRVGR
jgi:flagellar motor switch protein FliM